MLPSGEKNPENVAMDGSYHRLVDLSNVPK